MIFEQSTTERKDLKASAMLLGNEAYYRKKRRILINFVVNKRYLLKHAIG